jgi:ribosomal protein S18 acetylase RimI-like enzyme
MHIDIAQLCPLQADALRDQIAHVYREAFSGPPYFRDDVDALAFTETFRRHAQRRGFRCFVARKGRNSHIVGFIYGYTGESGQWWHDMIVRTMDSNTARQWMGDVLDLAELAVLPAMRGFGIGGQLHDLLLHDLPHWTAVLSTHQEETTALKLYTKRGWNTLLQHFLFPGYTIPYRIMGWANQRINNLVATPRADARWR